MSDKLHNIDAANWRFYILTILQKQFFHIPAANTNLPTRMRAERCSAWLNEDG